MIKIATVNSGIGKFAKRYIPQKLKPQELGVLLPEGIINFQSAAAAQKCAKNIAIDALHAPEPYERGVVVSGNQILDIIEGNKNGVAYFPIKYKRKISFVHGHPDMYAKGATSPVSLADYKSLLW